MTDSLIYLEMQWEFTHTDSSSSLSDLREKKSARNNTIESTNTIFFSF